MLDPITVIFILALVILLVWIVTKVPMLEPTRSIVIGFVVVGIVAMILKLLGLWTW
jgi:hypothetical protein